MSAVEVVSRGTSEDRISDLEARVTALEESNTRAEAVVLRLKYYAARRAYVLRDATCPAGDKADGAAPMTWAEWWAKRFGDGETLEQFMARAKSLNLRQRVLEYELVTFGKSALNGTAEVPQ